MTRLLAYLRASVDRWWFFPLMVVLAAVDLFIVVIPTEGLLVSASIVRPGRWWLAALSGALGSALGALVLGAAVHAWGYVFLERFAAGMLQSPSWAKTTAWVDRWGAAAMFGVSIGPLPQQPAVAICALGRIPLSTVCLMVLSARMLKYGLFCWLGTHAPWLLKKFGKPARELEEVKRLE